MGLEKIKHLSKIKNISLDELSDISGVPKSTINKIINGITENPGYKTILSLSHALSLSADEFIDLLDLDLEKPQFSASDKTLIDKYKSLDAFGKHTIDLLLERELDRYKQFKRLQHKTANLSSVKTVNEPTEDYGENVVMMPTLMQKLCAGTGSVGDDVQLENEPYPAIRVPAGAQYAATVAGDSMEPEYSDGDVVFFNDTNTPRFGDIVVLSINKENYLKKYTERGFEALNPKYDILVPGESDFVVVLGKVLGKL